MFLKKTKTKQNEKKEIPSPSVVKMNYYVNKMFVTCEAAEHKSD